MSIVPLEIPESINTDAVLVFGVDYSMTSPAVCSIVNGTYTVRFLTSTQRHAQTHEFDSLVGRIVVIGDPYPEYHSQDERFDLIAQWALKGLGKGRIIIEDYSMGSKGRVFHIAENCGLLKHKIWSGGLSYETIPPTSLKKFATGKGNSDKTAMHAAFKQLTGIDLMAEMTPNAKECSSPVSDVVDAFFLARFGLTD